LSNELQPKKKAVIAANSAFGALLNVSPFNIPTTSLILLLGTLHRRCVSSSTTGTRLCSTSTW
jgi:hypothetical protein